MIYKNSSKSVLIEESLKRNETMLSANGALVSYTGKITGRSPKDRYVVRDSETEALVEWGKVNVSITPEIFAKVKAQVIATLDSKDTFQEDLSVGADPRYSMAVTVRSELAYGVLFAKTMFRAPLAAGTKSKLPSFNVYHAPSVKVDPKALNVNSEVFVAINFTSREILVCGTQYAGEVKKSIFTVMNTLLPKLSVMPMHASANLDKQGRSAIFFGLSGTGKTTLSSDPLRGLIGDDEHGWTDEGVFNFEGGCYAKTIKLSATAEPEIWKACHTFGTILENVVMNKATREINFDSEEITENTRASYPLEFINNYEPTGCGGHPTAIVMLTCDAFGILPPVARLTAEQASYYFLSGYTAKVAGTEAGVKEPQSTFSACFGEAFMTLPPTEYAKLLAERINKFKTPCYLVNTGWWKGPVGVGERMPIKMSRAIVNAAVSGELASVPVEVDPQFGFSIPKQVQGINPEFLNMINTWQDKAAYKEAAVKLIKMFNDNFKRYESKVTPEIKSAAPSVK